MRWNSRVIWKLAHRVPPSASTEPGMINTPFTPMLESAIEGTPLLSNEAGEARQPEATHAYFSSPE